MLNNVFLVVLFLTTISNSFPRDSISVPFLANVPVMDGIPDDIVNNLAALKFETLTSTAGNPHFSDISYKIAYGTTFFYLYIEIPGDKIISRDRAYQMGDGFHLTFAAPQENNSPSDEFYVLGFSPGKENWQGQFIWYHNRDLTFRVLEKTITAFYTKEGKIGVEVLVPWSEIYPYHPWMGKIGFNFCYVEAVEKNDKNYYFTLYDRYMQSENSSREYINLHFNEPVDYIEDQAYITLQKNNIYEGEKIEVNGIFLTPVKGEKRLHLKISAEEGSSIKAFSFSFDAEAGLNKKTFTLDISDLSPGGYTVIRRVNNRNSEKIGVSILPEFNYENILNKVGKLNISSGSHNTILFTAAEIKKQIGNLKAYSTAPEIRSSIYSLNSLINSAEKGVDVLAEKNGVFRRAYLSGVDSSLIPYSIRIPEGYTGKTNYPLLVYLHGSGEDDRNQLNRTFTNDKFIEAAVNGRGTSNCYSADNAQEDIREALADIEINYSIDKNNIFLLGFSMGGYGVLRTYYENGKLFKGIALFSGHPSLANNWLGEGHPDFMKDKYLAALSDVPVFLYHGKEDNNCPFDLIHDFVAKLKKTNNKVEYYFEEGKGHAFPGNDVMSKFELWMTKLKD